MFGSDKPDQKCHGREGEGWLRSPDGSHVVRITSAGETPRQVGGGHRRSGSLYAPSNVGGRPLVLMGTAWIAVKAVPAWWVTA
jgi:hypothetical protein